MTSESLPTLDPWLDLAAAGYHLIPVTLHTRPNGKKDVRFHVDWRDEAAASTDPGQVKAWWVDNPDVSFAIDCGRSGIVVVDLDVECGKDGVAWWSEQGHPISTMRVETRTGGLHLYFRADPDRPLRNTAGTIAPGVDTRAVGGCVFAPGSTVLDAGAVVGRYALLDPLLPVDQLPPAPELLYEDPAATQKRAWASDGRIVTHNREWMRQKADEQREQVRNWTPGGRATSGGKRLGFRYTLMGAAMFCGRLAEAGLSTVEDVTDALLEDVAAVWGEPDEDDHMWIESGLADGPRKERWRVRASETGSDGAQTVGDERPPLRRLKVTRASEIAPRRLRWLWDLRIVLGGLTLIAGREGLGKSTIAAWLAALVTQGKLSGELYGQPRTVVYVNSEDARDYTIRPRLEAAGADLDRVIFVDAVMPGEGGEEFTESIVLPRDAHLLAELVRTEGAALVILDAATSVIDSKLDGDKDRQMRQGLEAIGRVVGEGVGAAVTGIVHFGKRDSSDTGKLILGSIAWSQVARSVLAVARNEEDSSLVITRSKGNLGIEPPSIAVRIVSATVSTPEEGDTSVGRVELIGETNQDARDLLGAVQPDCEERTALDEAADWLHDYLIQYDKPPSKKAKEDGRKARHQERTIERSLKTLGVTVSSAGFPRQSYWRLPDGHSADSCARCASVDGRAREHGATGATEADLGKPDDPAGATAQSRQPHVHGATGGVTGATGGVTGATCDACGRRPPVIKRSGRALCDVCRAEDHDGDL